MLTYCLNEFVRPVLWIDWLGVVDLLLYLTVTFFCKLEERNYFEKALKILCERVYESNISVLYKYNVVYIEFPNPIFLYL